MLHQTEAVPGSILLDRPVLQCWILDRWGGYYVLDYHVHSGFSGSSFHGGMSVLCTFKFGGKFGSESIQKKTQHQY
jgi:hypothetical protein